MNTKYNVNLRLFALFMNSKYIFFIHEIVPTMYNYRLDSI